MTEQDETVVERRSDWSLDKVLEQGDDVYRDEAELAYLDVSVMETTVMMAVSRLDVGG